MKRKFTCLIIFFVMSPLLLFSQQKVWTLEEAIGHALQNNIQIKQQEIATKYQAAALELSRMSQLPTLNGSASHNYSFGRALDETTYEFTDNQTVQSNNFSASTGVTLFRGLVTYNTIKRNRYQLMASEQDLEGLKDDISMSIALAYLQILLNTELVTATVAQVDMTKQQIDRTQKLVNAGSLARGNLLDIEAQAAREELQLINLQNQLTMSYLTLAQMLELPSVDDFAVSIPEITIDPVSVTGDPEGILSIAEKTRPEIIGAEYRLKGSEYDLAIAKGGRSPRLGFGASVGTAYSDNRINPFTLQPYTFRNQLSDNLNYGVGFSLNIPILNGWQVNTNISNSKLGIESSKYSLEATRKQLYKNIQQAFTDATGALKKYSASRKAVEAMEESFRYAESKLNQGMVTAVEYNQSKTQLLNAQSEMAQAKYEYVFKTKVLDFYKGIPITLQHLNILAK